MNPWEQRIAIAQACGWKIENYGPHGYETLYWLLREPDGRIRCNGCTGEEWSRLQFALMVPNYTGDLNAMKKVDMEVATSYEHANTYVTHLEAVVERDLAEMESPPPFRFMLVNASASQRAEALLRFLQLWKEGA